MDNAGKFLSVEAKQQWNYYTITLSAEKLLAQTASSRTHSTDLVEQQSNSHSADLKSSCRSADLKSSLPDGERKYDSNLFEDHSKSSCKSRTDDAARFLALDAKQMWDYYTITSPAEKFLALSAFSPAPLTGAVAVQDHSGSAGSNKVPVVERKGGKKSDLTAKDPFSVTEGLKEKGDLGCVSKARDAESGRSGARASGDVSQATPHPPQSGRSGTRTSGGVSQTTSHPPQSGRSGAGVSGEVPQLRSHPQSSGHSGARTSGGLPQTRSHPPQSGHSRVGKTTSNPLRKNSTACITGAAKTTSPQLIQGISWSCALGFLTLFSVLTAIYLGRLKFWTLSGGRATTETLVLFSTDSECLSVDLEDQHAITLQRLFLLHYIKAEKTKELRIIREIAGHWQELGLLLGLKNGQIAQNPQNLGPDYVKNCCTQVLREWLEKGAEGYQVSWKGFIKAIKDLQLYRTAGELEDALNCVIT